MVCACIVLCADINSVTIYVLFCQDPLTQLAIDVSSVMHEVDVYKDRFLTI